MAIADKQPRLYLGVDLDDIETIHLAGGTACVYTRRAPDKETDNEDSLALIPCGAGSAVLAVADGLGGLPAGDQASSRAIRSLSDSVTTACAGEQPALREAILDGIEHGDNGIRSRLQGAGTTLAAVSIENRQVRSYHVGDSATLITGQRGKLKMLTIAHSPVGYGVEAGLIEADAALYHEERHLVSNIVGMKGMRVEIGPPLTLAPRDTILIASDGLYDNMQIEEITDTIRAGPLDRAAATLREICRQRMSSYSENHPHKPDDLSFIVFRHSPRS